MNHKDQLHESDGRSEPCKPGAVFMLYADLWNLLRPGGREHIRGIITIYLVSLAGIAATFCGPLFLANMLDYALPKLDRKLFYLYSAGVLVSLAVFFLCSLLKTYYMTGVSERMFLSLRNRLMTTLLKKPARFFSQSRSGDIITRISNDTEHLSLLVFDYALAGINGVTMIILFVALMLMWEWRLGLYTVLTLPCYVLLLSLVQKPLFKAAKTARRAFSEQNDTMLDIVSGVREIRFHQQFKASGLRFAEASGRFTAANIRSLMIGEWGFNSMELFSRLIAVIPFLLGGYWICSGIRSVSIGDLIAANLYLTYIASSLEVVNVGVTRMAQAVPLVERLRELLEFPEEIPAGSAETAAIPDSTRIEYRGVSFCYDPSRPLLRGFSLTIEPGDKVALMGPSGAGKSTLIELLTRRISPETGEILFGGRPVDAYGLALYLMNFAYVPQKPYIFRTSVRENISLGWQNTPLDIIMDAAARVRIHEAIVSLPQGYDTVMGLEGVEMSGGQLQRLALARALVRDPAVLLLDEFTSALDHHTESEILNDLMHNFQRQTVICVTHSQAVASHFSRIVRLEKI